jgi:hypothetical protein
MANSKILAVIVATGITLIALTAIFSGLYAGGIFDPKTTKAPITTTTTTSLLPRV